MGRTVYAAQLWTDASDVTSVLEEYNLWIGQFYTKNYNLSNIEPFGGSLDGLPDRHHIDLSSVTSDQSEIYDLDWRYPSSNDPNLLWINSVRVARLDGSCLFEHRISIEALEFIIRPTPLVVGAPNVVRRLCRRGVVRFGKLKLKASPYYLSEKNFSEFLDLLRSSDRRLPIIFLTPFANGDNPDLDSDALASSLAGVAIVVEAVDRDATWELRAEIGKELACFDGGARIYWPGFSGTDSRALHPLFLGQRIREDLQRTKTHIERLIFNVAAEKYVPHRAVEEIVRGAHAAARRSQLAATEIPTDWKELAEGYLAQLETSEERVSELKTQLENVRVLTPVTAEDESTDAAPLQPETVPQSVAEAVQNAESNCSQLIFTDSARKSASDSPFMRPREVQDALEQLNEVAREWRERRNRGEAGGDLRRMLMDKGLGKRCSMHISDTTRGKFGSDYTFTVDGTAMLVEPHITLGSGDAGKCASIHFLPPTESRGIVVVHVGRHLPNTKA